jgi:hypothetical protein
MVISFLAAELNTSAFYVSHLKRYCTAEAKPGSNRYNSAISVSIPQYGYPTVVASESFVQGTDYSPGNWTFINLQSIGPHGDRNEWPPIEVWDHVQAFQKIRANANNKTLYERLDNRHCIEKYSNVFSARSTLVVVTEDLPGDKNASVHQYIYWPAQYGGYSRYNPCNSGVDNSDNSPDCQTLSANTPQRYEAWRRFGRRVLYCLSERMDDHCQLNYSPKIFIGT